MTDSPLLSVNNARVDRDGAVICENLSFDLNGTRAVIEGPGAEGILSAICMSATVAKGSITVAGHEVASRSHVGHVGIAPLDPPLPPYMTVARYLELSFRTLGLPKKLASAAVHESLTALGLTSIARRATRSLATHERRALILAAAMIPGSNTLVAQAPLLGLEGPECQYVLSVLERASASRRILASVSRYDTTSAEQDIIVNATEVALVSREAVLWLGSASGLLSGAPMLAVHVDCTSNPSDPPDADIETAFLEALKQAGFTPQGRPPRLTVALTEQATTMNLLSIARATNVTVLELIPLVQAQRVKPNVTTEPTPTEPTAGQVKVSDDEQPK